MEDETLPTLPAWDLVRTAHVIGLRLQAMFEQLELSPRQFGVLAALERGERPSQAELARHVLVSPPSMNALVASLLERGLVERGEPAGRGGRIGIEITPAGRTVLAAAWPHVQAGTAGSTLGLDDAETETLVGLLARVRAAS